MQVVANITALLSEAHQQGRGAEAVEVFTHCFMQTVFGGQVLPKNTCVVRRRRCRCHDHPTLVHAGWGSVPGDPGAVAYTSAALDPTPETVPGFAWSLVHAPKLPKSCALSGAGRLQIAAKPRAVD